MSFLGSEVRVIRTLLLESYTWLVSSVCRDDVLIGSMKFKSLQVDVSTSLSKPDSGIRAVEPPISPDLWIMRPGIGHKRTSQLLILRCAWLTAANFNDQNSSATGGGNFKLSLSCMVPKAWRRLCTQVGESFSFLFSPRIIRDKRDRRPENCRKAALIAI